MKAVKTFLAVAAAVLALDFLWWGAARYLPPIAMVEPTNYPWFVPVDPTLSVPWLVIGLAVAVFGWTRVRSLVPHLVVTLGALAGTVAAFGLMVAWIFMGNCGCEPS